MATTDILKIVPALQATAIAGSVYKSTRHSRRAKPMKQTGKFVKVAARAIVGITLMRETAKLTGSI